MHQRRLKQKNSNFNFNQENGNVTHKRMITLPIIRYFLAVTHEYHMITRSEVKLFVDNQKFGSTLSYPKIAEVKEIS